ncbi:MAG: hypothetical protein IJZ37_01240 [Clostridia bacterium]|nr:hypothetical protein [Clostridia bacterium]
MLQKSSKSHNRAFENALLATVGILVLLWFVLLTLFLFAAKPLLLANLNFTENELVARCFDAVFEHVEDGRTLGEEDYFALSAQEKTAWQLSEGTTYLYSGAFCDFFLRYEKDAALQKNLFFSFGSAEKLHDYTPILLTVTIIEGLILSLFLFFSIRTLLFLHKGFSYKSARAKAFFCHASDSEKNEPKSPLNRSEKIRKQKWTVLAVTLLLLLILLGNFTGLALLQGRWQKGASELVIEGVGFSENGQKTDTHLLFFCFDLHFKKDTIEFLPEMTIHILDSSGKRTEIDPCLNLLSLVLWGYLGGTEYQRITFSPADLLKIPSLYLFIAIFIAGSALSLHLKRKEKHLWREELERL